MEYTGIHTYSTRCDGYGFMTVTLSVTDFSEEHSDRGGARCVPGARGRLHQGERDRQRQDDAAEPVVGDVLQAPPAALVGGASRAGATGLRLGGRAQLVRNWSVYGQIKTTARARMGHAVGDKLVFCHEALHLKNKLQKAGSTSKQVAEKWDSDSDSDQSDEEGFDYII